MPVMAKSGDESEQVHHHDALSSVAELAPFASVADGEDAGPAPFGMLYICEHY